jgi:serine/threonine protein kinase
MLCYRCGSIVAVGARACAVCGQGAGSEVGPLAGFGGGSKPPRLSVDSAPLKAGDVVDERFEIVSAMGAGATGWVFECVDRESSERGALKLVHPRFVQEAGERRALREALSHVEAGPGAVVPRHVGEAGGSVFAVSPFVRGRTLRRLMDERAQAGRRWEVEEVRELFGSIARVVGHAVHGQLKAGNVMLTDEGVRVLDFGWAHGLPRAPLQAAQRAAGNHRLFAPEFLHVRTLDAGVDVYALGALGSELVGPGDGDVRRELVLQAFRRASSGRREERPVDLPALVEAMDRALALSARTVPPTQMATLPPPPPPPPPLPRASMRPEREITEEVAPLRHAPSEWPTDPGTLRVARPLPTAPPDVTSSWATRRTRWLVAGLLLLFVGLVVAVGVMGAG